jgi:hypothetical protein
LVDDRSSDDAVILADEYDDDDGDGDGDLLGGTTIPTNAAPPSSPSHRPTLLLSLPNRKEWPKKGDTTVEE